MLSRILVPIGLAALTTSALALAEPAPQDSPRGGDDELEVPAVAEPSAPPAAASPTPRAASSAPGTATPTPSAASSAPGAASATPPEEHAPATATSLAAPSGATSAPESNARPLLDVSGAPTKSLEFSPYGRPVPRGFFISGYAQLQYQSNQASEDQLQQGGAPFNQNEFVVRRARLRIDRAWEYAAGTIELDGNYARGASFSLRRAEGSLLYRGSNDDNVAPIAMLTLGLFDVPFGYELVDTSRSRTFMERSLTSLALFPSEPDLGVRLSGAIGFFRYSLAVVNGEPLDNRTGRFPSDPNAAKDVVGRLGVDTQPSDSLRISGGTSFLNGWGFHPGSDATKDSTTWVDINENGSIDQGEISGVPGRAAQPSQNFRRWAFGADLQVRLRTWLGWSTLYGEAYVASNLDRGLFVADPVLTGSDVREVGYYAALVQELGRYGLIGFRFDYYDPHADFLTQRGGKLLPSSQRVRTYSPLVGLVLPEQAKLLFQYDIVNDRMGKDARGVPADLKNNQWTLRLQVML